jgi:CRP-like cAMP-binding protein
MASMQDRVAASIHSKKGEPLNRLLAVLPDSELLKLQPHLQALPLAPGSVLFDADKRAERVYFLDTGVASLAAALENRVAVGVATVGREGVVGAAPLLLGGATTLGRARVLVRGSARTVEVSAFRRALGSSSKLRAACETYSRVLLAQVLQAVPCSRLHTAEQRCARWLLMCADRADGDKFELRRECLAEMLGVPQAMLEVVARKMENAGLICDRQGAITVLDRPGLETTACGCYRILHERNEWINSRQSRRNCLFLTRC